MFEAAGVETTLPQIEDAVPAPLNRGADTPVSGYLGLPVEMLLGLLHDPWRAGGCSV
jgi:hypothetical protein